MGFFHFLNSTKKHVENRVIELNNLQDDINAMADENTDATDVFVRRTENYHRSKRDSYKHEAKSLKREIKELKKEAESNLEIENSADAKDKSSEGVDHFEIETEDGIIKLNEDNKKVEVPLKQGADSKADTVKVYEKKGNKLFVSEKRVDGDKTSNISKSKIVSREDGVAVTNRYTNSKGQKAVLSSEFKQVGDKKEVYTQLKDFDGKKYRNTIPPREKEKLQSKSNINKEGVKPQAAVNRAKTASTAGTNASKASLDKTALRKNTLTKAQLNSKNRLDKATLKSGHRIDSASKVKFANGASVHIGRAESVESIKKKLSAEMLSKKKEIKKIERKSKRNLKSGVRLGRLWHRRSRNKYVKKAAYYKKLKETIATKEQLKLFKSERERKVYYEHLRTSGNELTKATKRLQASDKAIAKREAVRQRVCTGLRVSNKSVLNATNQSSEDLIKAGTSGVMGEIFSHLKDKIDPIALLKRNLMKYVISAMGSIFSYIMTYILPIILAIVVCVAVVDSTVGWIGRLFGFGGGDDDGGGSATVNITTAEKYANWPDNKAFGEDDIKALVEERKDATEDQKKLLKYVFEQVGKPYSQEPNERMSGDMFDCSSLAYSAEKSRDKDIGNLCAADQAKKLIDDDKQLTQDGDNVPNMEIGDLIYYGGKDNGRYEGIHHVAIYVGNGYVVEAFNKSRGVVYQKIWQNEDNVMYACRP